MKLFQTASDPFEICDSENISYYDKQSAFASSKQLDLRLDKTDQSHQQQQELLQQQFCAQQYSYQQKFPNKESLTLMIEGRVAGSLVFQERRRGTLIIDFFIIPAFRQKGIGARVMANLQQRNAVQNRHILARVRCYNKRAHQFYRSCGFLPVVSEQDEILFEWQPN